MKYIIIILCFIFKDKVFIVIYIYILHNHNHNHNHCTYMYNVVYSGLNFNDCKINTRPNSIFTLWHSGKIDSDNKRRK